MDDMSCDFLHADGAFSGSTQQITFFSCVDRQKFLSQFQILITSAIGKSTDKIKSVSEDWFYNMMWAPNIAIGYSVSIQRTQSSIM